MVLTCVNGKLHELPCCFQIC